MGYGHKTYIPSSVTYSTVLSRGSVRIYLTIASLNNIDILASYIENAYITYTCLDKVWMRDGSEFGKL